MIYSHSNVDLREVIVLDSLTPRPCALQRAYPKPQILYSINHKQP